VIENFPVHDTGTYFCQETFTGRREFPEKIVRKNSIEDRIAQILQSFIVYSFAVRQGI
jgi:hypothetical protein